MHVPYWLEQELAANHPGVEVRWVDYDKVRKTFVIPVTGDAFWRLVTRKLGGETVLYRRHIGPTTALKWTLMPSTVYIPEPECVTDGRWVVFQTNVKTDETIKVFDVVNDDGSLHPLDMRVIEGLLVRDGKYGAHERAIRDVEAAPEKGEAIATANLVEACGDLFERIHYDVAKAIGPAGACVPEPDPADDAVSIEHGPSGSPAGYSEGG